MANPKQKALMNAKNSSGSWSSSSQGGSGRIITAGDSKVCPACRKAAMTGSPLPPDHPNCRCQKIRTA